MRSTSCLIKSLLAVALPPLMLLSSQPAQALTLTFSATLLQATCQVSVSHPTLFLGAIGREALAKGSVLINPTPFAVSLRNCSGGAGGVQSPGIKISGEGFTTGDGKWLFRSASSVAANVGVMLTAGSTAPTYAKKEIKQGENIAVGAVGTLPVEQDLHFYASATCGDLASCRAMPPGTGKLTARVVFDFVYF